MQTNGRNAWTTVFLPLFVLLALGALGTKAQDNAPAFRTSSSELVVLPVVVTDRPDRFVVDLARDRFAVFDNDRQVPIELFSNEDTPVTVGLVIDASGSMRHKIAEVAAATLAFAKSSNPDDELFAVRFNDDVRDVVDQVTGRPFLEAGDIADLHRALNSLVAQGRTALYDALVAALDHLDKGARARKVLIVVSDGGDNASQATLDGVLARARASNAAIYTIGIYDEDDLDKNPRALKSLAKATGGERFLPQSPGPLLTACMHIAREIRSGYTIGYTPPARDGAFHRVRVNVTAPDNRKLTVRTRPGYFASPPPPRTQG